MLLLHCLINLFTNHVFNLIMQVRKVPDSFGLSYTIPLLKVKTSCMSKSLCVKDFRGISITPLLSKLFENVILAKFESYFVTSDKQFGLKKKTQVVLMLFIV